MVNWSTIRELGKVKLFHVSFVILFGAPALAFLFNSGLFNFITGRFIYPVILKWGYFSSLFFSFAIFLYQIFCPDIVKQHSKRDYIVNKTHDIFAKSNRELYMLPIKERAERERVVRDASSLAMTDDEINKAVFDQIVSENSTAFEKYYIEMDKKYAVVRFMCIAFYILGFIAMMIVIISEAHDVLVV